MIKIYNEIDISVSLLCWCEFHGSAPFTVKTTAGLRLLDATQAREYVLCFHFNDYYY